MTAQQPKSTRRIADLVVTIILLILLSLVSLVQLILLALMTGEWMDGTAPVPKGVGAVGSLLVIASTIGAFVWSFVWRGKGKSGIPAPIVCFLFNLAVVMVLSVFDQVRQPLGYYG